MHPPWLLGLHVTHVCQMIVQCGDDAVLAYLQYVCVSSVSSFLVAAE